VLFDVRGDFELGFIHRLFLRTRLRRYQACYAVIDGELPVVLS
jgi:hypothetical protein